MASEIKKPELSEEQKAKINELYQLLKQRVWTKTELQIHFGMSERNVRRLISELAKKKPIISVSTEKGYKVATGKADLPSVEHCWRELDSRIEELEARKKPLIDFREKMIK
ncbi:MAG: hypothetical protein IJV77_06600 [Clostridia bacterium]|nr:hypothetical protein [Clostridia bacterium]